MGLLCYFMAAIKWIVYFKLGNHNNKNSFYICYIFKNPMIIAIYLCHHLLGFMLDCYREKKGW